MSVENKKIYAQDFTSESIAKGEVNLDVRDSEFIWCESSVMAIVESKDEENHVIIHYKGWSNKYDEILPISSPRIAKLGSYTSRKDIPKYQDSPNKSRKFILNLANASSSVVDKLKKKLVFDQMCIEDSPENSDEEIPKTLDDHYEYLIEMTNGTNI